MAVVARWILSVSLLTASLSSATPLPSNSTTTLLYTTSSSASSGQPSLALDTSAPAASSLATPVAAVSLPQGGLQANEYWSPAFVPVASHGLQPALSQYQTNGQSVWGTLNASALPPWLDTPGQPMPQGYPWGGATASNTNPYTSPPNTGMTRKYSFTVAMGTIAPDGVEKEAILINGAFPGPLIEANWGDMIEVEVTNSLPDEGTSLHW